MSKEVKDLYNENLNLWKRCLRKTLKYENTPYANAVVG